MDGGVELCAATRVRSERERRRNRKNNMQIYIFLIFHKGEKLWIF